MFRDVAPKSAPGFGDPLPNVLVMATENDTDDFRAGIDPDAQAGKPDALLTQFPASFRSKPMSRGYLGCLLRLLSNSPQVGVR